MKWSLLAKNLRWAIDASGVVVDGQCEKDLWQWKFCWEDEQSEISLWFGIVDACWRTDWPVGQQSIELC